jgi:hypothetical protein
VRCWRKLLHDLEHLPSLKDSGLVGIYHRVYPHSHPHPHPPPSPSPCNRFRVGCLNDVFSRGTTGVKYSQGTPTQSHVSPSILTYEGKTLNRLRGIGGVSGEWSTEAVHLSRHKWPVGLVNKDCCLIKVDGRAFKSAAHRDKSRE